jgi:hypothetical protein
MIMMMRLLLLEAFLLHILAGCGQGGTRHLDDVSGGKVSGLYGFGDIILSLYQLRQESTDKGIPGSVGVNNFFEW